MSQSPAAALPAVAFFGFIVFFPVMRALRAPVVELTADGFVSRAGLVGPGFVRWREVDSIRVTSFFGRSVLVRYASARRVSIPELMLPMKAEGLIRLMEHHAEAAGVHPQVTLPPTVSDVRRRLELAMFVILGILCMLVAAAGLALPDADGDRHLNVVVVGLVTAVACFVFARRRLRPSPRQASFRL